MDRRPTTQLLALGRGIISATVAIMWKFFRDENQSWVNVDSYSTARLTRPLMDSKRINQLFGLGRDIISATVAMFTDHCVIGRHAERMGLPFNDFFRGCRCLEEEETILHFLCQCPSSLGVNIGYLARHFLSALRSYLL